MTSKKTSLKKTRPAIYCSPVTLPSVVNGQSSSHYLVAEHDELLLFMEIDAPASLIEILAIEHEGESIVDHYEEVGSRLRACLVPVRVLQGSHIIVSARNNSADIRGFRGLLCGIALASEISDPLSRCLSWYLDNLAEISAGRPLTDADLWAAMADVEAELRGDEGAPVTDAELRACIRDANGFPLDPPTVLSSVRRLCAIGVEVVERSFNEQERMRRVQEITGFGLQQSESRLKLFKKYLHSVFYGKSPVSHHEV